MQVPELQRHCTDWEILEPPEIRNVTPAGAAQKETSQDRRTV
jgi:hypothetical protein